MAKRIPLDNICAKKIPTLSSHYDGLIDYADISSVDNTEKRIVSMQCISAKEAPSRAKQLLEVGDILVSTVRPNLNAVAMVEQQTDNLLVGSTGYCVLRCSDIVDKRYVFYFCQSPYFVDDMTSQATGASYPAVSSGIVKSSTIPHHPIEMQKQIADRLDKVSELITLRKEQLAKLDQLVKSRFIEMFGTVKNNHQGYPVVMIGDCAKLQGGFAFKSLDYIDDGIRLVQISNVNKDTLDWDSINYVPQAFLQKYKDFELHIGDLVLAMTRPVIKSLDAVKIARVSEYDVPSLLNQRVGRFVIDKAQLNVVYLMSCCQMTEFREYVEAMSGNSLQPNISSKQVENYSIILPPLDLQEQFAAFVEQTNKLKLAIQQSLDKLEVLKKTLMQEFFG